MNVDIANITAIVTHWLKYRGQTMKLSEKEKRNAVYDLMRVDAELRKKAEAFASGGKTKTERNMRAGWYIGKHRKGVDE